MACLSRGVGQYVASEASVAVWGRTGRTGQRAVLYLQGSHAVADSFLGDATGKVLGDAGFVAICGDLSQTTSQGTFGNTTAQTRTGQLRTYIQGASSPLAAAAGKVHILGASGGVAAGINYARANPSNVASIYAVAPLVNLQDLYENRTDVSVTQAEINTAYGGDVTASYTTHDPSHSGNQAALAGIPIRIAYSTNDPYVPVSVVTAYQTLIQNAGGTCSIVSQGAVGHSAAGMDRQDLVQFFANHP